ncbi:MAG: ATPase [Thermoproteota archaeon]|nr:MAG: ATPase [Candidatus Korarchaeota archaeon]
MEQGLGKNIMQGRTVSYRNALIMLVMIGVIVAGGSIILVKSYPVKGKTQESVNYIGLFAAALSVSGSAIGAGIAIYGAATGGFAASAEKPELSVWVLVIAGLGEGLAIYGLVVAIMILGMLH